MKIHPKQPEAALRKQTRRALARATRAYFESLTLAELDDEQELSISMALMSQHLDPDED